MTQQLDNQPQSRLQSQPETHHTPVPIPPAIHLQSETVRALVVHLTQAEDILRDLEPVVLRNGRLVVNPARQPWIARSRRTAWRRGDLPGLVITSRSSNSTP